MHIPVSPASDLAPVPSLLPTATGVDLFGLSIHPLGHSTSLARTPFIWIELPLYIKLLM